MALFLFALAVHLFLAMGGLLIGIDFKALIIIDELGAILAAPLAFAMLLRLDLREAFGLRAAHWSHYVMAGLGAVPLQVFGGAMMEIVIEAMPSGDAWREMIESSLENMLATETTYELILLMFGGVVLAAICEEILFRGMILRLLTRNGQWRVAIIISSVLFAVFHLDPIGLLPRTLMGAYFGLLVWRSGSIFPAMIAHGANNLLAFGALPFADSDAPALALSPAALLAAVSGLVFAGLLLAYLRLTPRPSRHGEVVQPPPTAEGTDAGVPN